jgi:hypothetical protein
MLKQHRAQLESVNPMKATKATAKPEVKAAKPVAKPVATPKPVAKKHLSHDQRSAIARAAAAKAWKTMGSKKYKQAAAKSPAAVKAYLESRVA